MLGYQKEEIVSKYIFSLIPKSELPTVQIAFQETKEKGNMRIETKFIRKDGTEIFVDVISKIVDKKKRNSPGNCQGYYRSQTIPAEAARGYECHHRDHVQDRRYPGPLYRRAPVPGQPAGNSNCSGITS